MVLALKILDWIKNNFTNTIIIGLILVVILQRCDKNPPIEKPKIVKDTVWVKKENIYITNPTLVKSIPGKPGKEYLPNPNYEKLVLQYQDIVNAFLAKNSYKDSIKIDSIGYIKITDTISKNLISGRKVFYSLKYPVITNTITISQKKTNQLYYGGGLQGSQEQLINQFNIGVLLKTKSDQIYNVYTGMDTNGQVQVGLQAYWKINLNKKN